MNPATKSWPIETLAMTPKTIIGSEGGMIGPIVEDPAVMPTANSG
jgi:hypothetical protein